MNCRGGSFPCHLPFYSPICGWLLPEDAWARGRALGWCTGTGTLAMGLHNCGCCRSRVECVANRIGYNGGSICQDYCWEGWTLTQQREEQIERGEKQQLLEETWWHSKYLQSTWCPRSWLPQSLTAVVSGYFVSNTLPQAVWSVRLVQGRWKLPPA